MKSSCAQRGSKPRAREAEGIPAPGSNHTEQTNLSVSNLLRQINLDLELKQASTAVRVKEAEHTDGAIEERAIRLQNRT
jgi:hypothetical protein